MNVHIEKARAEDAAALWKLRSDALRTQCAGYYDAELLEAWAGSKMPEGFARDAAANFDVIRDGRRIVACGLVSLKDGSIDALFVDPAAFGQGHGRAMLEHLQAQAQQHGLQHLRLDASLNAVGFYRNCGFVGDKIGKYRSPSGFELDCMPMEKSIA